jgi:two-component sensor histidine kinase
MILQSDNRHIRAGLARRGATKVSNYQYPEVELSCHCEPVLLDLDGVTAIGLVISELMSNSYAHAFPCGTGSIKVSLHRNETGDDATLTFADDGIGFTQYGDARWHGLALVKRLMEQVNGSATLRSDHGSEWTLKFPVPTNLLVD